MGFYPLFLDLTERPCLVVGGGPVAERKVDGLLAVDARVTVVSPQLTSALATLVADGRVSHLARPHRRGDLVGAVLVFTALDDPVATTAVAEEARDLGVWMNAADDPTQCDFFLPALVRRGALTVAVGSGGTSPALTRALRDHIEAALGAEWTELAEIAAEARRELQAAGRKADGDTWRRALGPDVRGLLRPASRVIEERPGSAGARRALAGGVGGGRSPLRSKGWEAMSGPPTPTVALVGAGPGDPGLMTVRGLALLRKAEIVVYDRLVDPRLLDEAPLDARRIFAGKASGAHTLPQAQINALLIAHARRGRRVVRLKGGDPFVFGRGGEEAEALAAAGIAFEIVPGVSSAIAVPSYAGIPVTHRGVASSFAVVTGHEEDGKTETSVDWARLATAVDTLVILMGVHRLPHIARALLDAGRAPDTPVALVRWGTTDGQATLVGRLDAIAPLAAAAALMPPVVIVVGNVVALRERLAWFSGEAAADAGVREVEPGVVLSAR